MATLWGAAVKTQKHLQSSKVFVVLLWFHIKYPCVRDLSTLNNIATFYTGLPLSIIFALGLSFRANFVFCV